MSQPYNQQQNAHNPYAVYDEPYKTYNEPRFPHSGATEIKVEKIIFVPTGTYNDQWRCPWTTNYNVDNANAVHEAVGAAYRQHQVAKASGQISPEAQYAVDPMTLSGISSSFLQPSAVAEQRVRTNMAGGFGDQHGRFMMTLWVKRNQAVVATRYVVIGYTNHVGFSQSQNVDPMMEMTINTIFEVRDVTVNNGYGPVTESRLVQVNQILTDLNYQGPDVSGTIRLRPYEVAVSLARMNDPSLQGPSVTVVDTRDIQTETPHLSSQHHTNPNDYMAKIISGLVNGHNLSRQTGRSGVQEPYHAAAREMRDPTASADPFISAISKVAGNGTITSTFRWRDLVNLDANAESDHVCFIQWRDRMQYIGSIGENMHTAGETLAWNGQDISTQAARQIANILPSLMVDLALRKVDIFASNMAGPICVATNATGVVGGVFDLSPQMAALATTFNQQCVMATTYNGQILYEMRITADLFGEISITLRLDSQPQSIFVQPAYCSSAMSPVLTTRRDTLDNLSQAFHSLQQEAFPTQPIKPLIHDLGQSGTSKRY